jgi:ADP-ribose pyrophosphatase YjhB (NUDIX family)
MTLGVRGIAADADGRVVLVRHTYREGWYLPGGGVESGETLAEAAVKEMQEEAGVYATAPPRLFGVYSNHAAHRNDHVALFVFDAWREGPAAQQGEIAEIGWFAPDALPKGVTRASQARLDEVFGGRQASANW